MCISVLAPKQHLRIVYGSESVWLAKASGLPEMVADLLLHNADSEPIDELWCVVPQRLHNKNGSSPRKARFEDITHDLVNRDSRYTWYSAYEIHDAGNRTQIQLSLPNPTDDDADDITYSGWYEGGNSVREFTVVPRERVLMNLRMIDVAVIRMGRPIAPDESRWIRLHLRPLTGPLQQRDLVMMVLAYLSNDFVLSYNVSGPTKVRHDVRKNLASYKHVLIEKQSGNENIGELLTYLRNVEELLVTNGTEHSETKVEILDWRTRFFQRPMEPFSSAGAEGAVRISGAQPNFTDRIPRIPYYEWTSGSIQVLRPPERCAQGYFSVRFTTRFIPRFQRLLPWCGFFGLILALVFRWLSLHGQ